MAFLYKMAAVKQSTQTAQFSVRGFVKDISKEGIILNETPVADKKKTRVTPDLNFSVLYFLWGNTLLYGRLPPVPARLSLTCRHLKVNTWWQTGGRRSVKETVVPFVFWLILRRRLLLCSLCSLNQRRTAPLLRQCRRKDTKTLFWLQFFMCAHSDKPRYLTGLSSAAVTIVEVFHLLLRFLLQAC